MNNLNLGSFNRYVTLEIGWEVSGSCYEALQNMGEGGLLQ